MFLKYIFKNPHTTDGDRTATTHMAVAFTPFTNKPTESMLKETQEHLPVHSILVVHVYELTL